MGTKVSSVLKHKGYDVVTVAPHQTIGSVVKVLTQNRIGAAPVINEEGQLRSDLGAALHLGRHSPRPSDSAASCRAMSAHIAACESQSPPPKSEMERNSRIPLKSVKRPFLRWPSNRRNATRAGFLALSRIFLHIGDSGTERSRFELPGDFLGGNGQAPAEKYAEKGPSV